MATTEAPTRLLLIALDALPPALLDHWCADGSLPNLSRMRLEGRSGTVTSDADLFPGAVWPTFFTQSGLADHANYHLMQWDPGTRTLRPPGPAWCPVTPFWQRLAAQGHRVITLDVPFSDMEGDTANAIEVVGWSMHEGVWQTSHPAGVLKDLRRRHGRPRQVREGPGERPEAEITRELPWIVDDVGSRIDVIEDLARRHDWRLLLAAFSETHRAGHWFWSERGTGELRGGLKRVVQAFDSQLPRLRALLGPKDQLAVFSVHGMKDAFDSDRVAEGIQMYMRPPGARTRTSILDPVVALRRALPPRLVREIARKLPQRLYNWTYRHLQRSQGDWPRLPWVIQPVDQIAYFYSNLEAGDSEAREGLLNRLETDLLKIATPDGRPAIERVYRPKAHLQGSRAHLLPDLVPEPRTGVIGPELVFPGGAVHRPARHSSRDGEHQSDGFYLQVGPGIEGGSRGPTASGEDLAEMLCAPAGLHPK